MTTILSIINRAHIVKRVFLFPNLPKTEPKEPIQTKIRFQCHLGARCRRFKSCRPDQKRQYSSRFLPHKREHSSAGRASALQAEGHRFEPCCSHQKMKHRFFGALFFIMNKLKGSNLEKVSSVKKTILWTVFSYEACRRVSKVLRLWVAKGERLASQGFVLLFPPKSCFTPLPQHSKEKLCGKLQRR